MPADPLAAQGLFFDYFLTVLASILGALGDSFHGFSAAFFKCVFLLPRDRFFIDFGYISGCILKTFR